MDIKSRKLKILESIIKDYIQTAEPIGSRTIAKKYGLGISPATIRNEMSDLEEMGFLIQPHTSAGRIPSEKAYRLYVDELMKIRKLGAILEEDIKQGYNQYVEEIDKAMKHTAMVLSQLTSYTSLVLSPEIRSLNCKHVQLIPIQDERILMVIVSKENIIKNYELKLSKKVSADQLNKLSNVLNHSLKDINIKELSEQLINKIDELSIEENELLHEVIPLFKEVFLENEDVRFYSDGMTNILNYPEFSDIAKAKHFLKVFEKKQIIAELLSHSNDNMLNILIGNENIIDEFKECSLITATYHVNGKNIGTIGVIGPTRMNYDHVVSVLDFLRNQLNNHIKNALNE